MEAIVFFLFAWWCGAFLLVWVSPPTSVVIGNAAENFVHLVSPVVGVRFFLPLVKQEAKNTCSDTALSQRRGNPWRGSMQKSQHWKRTYTTSLDGFLSSLSRRMSQLSWTSTPRDM